MGFTTSMLPSCAGGGVAPAAGGAPATAGESGASDGFSDLFSLLQGGGQPPPAGAGSAAPRQLPLGLDAAGLPVDGSALPAGGGALPSEAGLLPGEAAANDGSVDAPLAALAALGWRQQLTQGGARAAEPGAADATAEAVTEESAEVPTGTLAIDPALVGMASQPLPPAVPLSGEALTAANAGSGAVATMQPQGGVGSGLVLIENGEAGQPAPALAQGALPSTGERPAGDFNQLLGSLESDAATAAVDNAAADTSTPLVREPAGRTAAPAQPTVATAQVPVPVGRPGWSEAVMEKVMWFSSQLVDSAEIQLSPPELGPVQVRISTQHEQASVYFASHSAAVRDALDQALPRLRELFESQGLQLADAGVGERSFAEQRAFQQGQNQEQAGQSGGSLRGQAGAESEPGVSTPVPVRVGLVDAYA